MYVIGQSDYNNEVCLNTKNTYSELDFLTTVEKTAYPYDIIQNSIPVPSKILHIKLCNERRKELVNFLIEICLPCAAR